MKAARYNRGGQADLYKMIESYMNGGKVTNYEDGGPVEGNPDVDPNSPEFQEYLKYRTRGNGNPLYHEEYKGERLSPSELRMMIRSQGKSMAIPTSLMPEGLGANYMNESMIGGMRTGDRRPTLKDAMSGANTRFDQNRQFEQEFLDYMKNKKGPAPRRQPGMILENTPQGELTQAEIALRKSMGL